MTWHRNPHLSPLVPWLPSGKHTKNYGKSPCFMGKSTISMAIFNSKLLVYRRVPMANPPFHGELAPGGGPAVEIRFRPQLSSGLKKNGGS